MSKARRTKRISQAREIAELKRRVMELEAKTTFQFLPNGGNWMRPGTIGAAWGNYGGGAGLAVPPVSALAF